MSLQDLVMGRLVVRMVDGVREVAIKNKDVILRADPDVWIESPTRPSL